MARVFKSADTDFQSSFDVFLEENRGADSDCQAVVRDIIASVRREGAKAVCEFTERFDRLVLSKDTLQSATIDVAALADVCPEDIQAAIRFAAKRIAEYHEAQIPASHTFEDDYGNQLGWKWTALSSVGVYAPGGRASYPSTILMNAIPAKIAGVERIVLTMPANDGEVSPAAAYAAHIAGIKEYYPIGGAQAVAGLAYGAGPLRAVDKIVGPGNAYVAEAKKQVFGKVGIDTIAGPSEICVVADKSANISWVCADLLSQAEHDPHAQSILICDNADFAEKVQHEIDAQLADLSTAEIARQSWQAHGGIIITNDLHAEAAALVNQIAPEHVELMCEGAESLSENIIHAGAIFIGAWASEALGDYVTGSNHVLPTSSAARFSSGLSVFDFLKRVSVQNINAEGFKPLAEQAKILAEAEGLPAHAAALKLRLGLNE